jgi:hypothetical protein
MFEETHITTAVVAHFLDGCLIASLVTIVPNHFG